MWDDILGFMWEIRNKIIEYAHQNKLNTKYGPNPNKIVKKSTYRLYGMIF
eukprot:UN18042